MVVWLRLFAGPRKFALASWIRGGSFSIKVVLPALFPNDPELDYHNLDGDVHNGSEAMNIYPMIAAMSADEQERARQSLLKYCELDTYAMVKVWEKLKEVVEK